MTENKILTADEIIAADDDNYNVVEVPEWGGSIRIRGLTAGEAINFQQQISNSKAKNEVLVRMVAMVAVDEEGNRIFKGKEQLEALKKKNIRPFLRIQDAFLEMNGLGDEKDIDEVEGNV